MSELRYTLVSDGSSDRALMRILTWLMREHGVNCPIQEEWADLRRLGLPPRTLPERILRSIELYPCDLLFVHRDAETIPRERRANEIRDALTEAAGIVPLPTAICVVPVRMQEAWLLFNEVALRRAAGNPNGHDDLDLPPLATVEQIPDPKQLLHDLLRQACALHGRRRRQFNVAQAVHRMAQFCEETGFAPLRVLPAFQALEADIQHIVIEQCWNA